MRKRIKFAFFRFHNNKRFFQEKRFKEGRDRKGFSLIEVVIGIALIGVGLLSLAQMFYYGVMNNANSDRLTNATFMAQQHIDFLRNLSAHELNVLTTNPTDEKIDLNGDGVIDIRRITRVVPVGFTYRVRVLIFSREQRDTNVNLLLNNPIKYRVRAAISTIISR